uniref:Secreted protein n=1 Tax=Arundo donax TaxID=35708 RepID=A0A0A9E2N5_ARUDO
MPLLLQLPTALLLPRAAISLLCCALPLLCGCCCHCLLFMRACSLEARSKGTSHGGTHASVLLLASPAMNRREQGRERRKQGREGGRRKEKKRGKIYPRFIKSSTNLCSPHEGSREFRRQGCTVRSPSRLRYHVIAACMGWE